MQLLYFGALIPQIWTKPNFLYTLNSVTSESLWIPNSNIISQRSKEPMMSKVAH